MNKGKRFKKVEKVTPTKAAKWLEKNCCNRKMKEWYAREKARAIDRGEHSGVGNHPVGGTTIRIAPDGSLLDGQHTLRAIVITGKSVSLDVEYNFPIELQPFLDIGMNRSLADRLSLDHAFGLGDVSGSELTIEKAMMRGVTAGRETRSLDEIKVSLGECREAIRFVLVHLRTAGMPGVINRGTQAVVARAYFHLDEAILIRFCQILRRGEIKTAKESAALRLWEFLVNDSKKGNTAEFVKRRYPKIEWALQAFANQKAVAGLRSATRELFPLPWEDEEEAAV